MKLFQIDEGVVCGRENNNDLFIRRATFATGYSEESFHYHKKSFEFYIILSGNAVFESDLDHAKIEASSGEIIYFVDSEKHRIAEVVKDVQMLLIKKIESEKIK